MRKKIKRRAQYHVYIVECKDGAYYTGYTNNLKKRIKLHNSGHGAKYTRARMPVKLVWRKKYKYFKRAILEEIRIKKLTRGQKEKLIGTIHELPVRGASSKGGNRLHRKGEV